VEKEATIAEEEALRKEKADLTEEISTRRNRVVTLEERVCDVASEQMERLVNQLNYDCIEGIRIDRKPTDAPMELSRFKLVVVRREDGVVMEERDPPDTLRVRTILVGLVVALAGYITHDVAETVPFLLPDSIEQFDAERIDRLLDYVQDVVDVSYVVAALHPEDARDVSVSDATIDKDDFVWVRVPVLFCGSPLIHETTTKRAISVSRTPTELLELDMYGK
jgi:hypothetical protein